MPERTATIGVDVGATLCKLVHLTPAGTATTALLPAQDLDGVRRQIDAWAPRAIGATGGGADKLGTEIDDVPVRQSGEFAAWGRGVTLVAGREGVLLPAQHLLVSIGTGTSILALRAGVAERIGGTALGGGTILGLGTLLVEQSAFVDLVALGARGDRRRVDLLIGDLYRTAPLAVLRDLSASNFAKLESRAPADVMHAVLGLVGETVALMAGAWAAATSLDTIVYCGTTLQGNQPLQTILRDITSVFGHTPRFLEHGAFCGAFGAAAFAADQIRA